MALIDDGVTSSFQSLDENIIHGESWAEARTQESYGSIPVISRLTTYTTSHTDHGTLMAWYIRRMCPHVQLCVAKLDPELAPASSGDDKVTFTIESVIKVCYGCDTCVHDRTGSNRRRRSIGPWRRTSTSSR